MERLPEVISVPIGNQAYDIVLALPFSWYLLWFASFSYFMAYILYNLTCPRFVREFPDFSVFLSQSHSPRFLVWELSRIWRDKFDRPRVARRLIDKGLAVKVTGPAPSPNPSVSTRGTAYVFDFEEGFYEVVAHENDSENRQRELFWEIFSPPARHAPLRRNLTWLLLTGAFLLVAVVVIEHVWFVLMYLFFG